MSTLNLLVFISTNVPGAREARGGPGHGEPHQRLRLPGVLGQDQGRRARGVWNGHQGGAAGSQAQEEGRLPPTVKRGGDLLPPTPFTQGGGGWKCNLYTNGFGGLYLRKDTPITSWPIWKTDTLVEKLNRSAFYVFMSLCAHLVLLSYGLFVFFLQQHTSLCMYVCMYEYVFLFMCIILTYIFSTGQLLLCYDCLQLRFPKGRLLNRSHETLLQIVSQTRGVPLKAHASRYPGLLSHLRVTSTFICVHLPFAIQHHQWHDILNEQYFIVVSCIILV